MTPGEMRVALERAWQDVQLVSDVLRTEHAAAFEQSRPALRETFAALLALDREVAKLD